MTDNDYTTIAVTPDDVERLNEIEAKHFDGNASYRQIINFLVDEKENREDSFEEVLAAAIARADTDDVERALQRTASDANWVRELNEGDGA